MFLIRAPEVVKNRFNIPTFEFTFSFIDQKTGEGIRDRDHHVFGTLFCDQLSNILSLLSLSDADYFISRTVSTLSHTYHKVTLETIW